MNHVPSASPSRRRMASASVMPGDGQRWAAFAGFGLAFGFTAAVVFGFIS